MWWWSLAVGATKARARSRLAVGQADVVVRFQAVITPGHTLVIDGVTYKLSAAALRWCAEQSYRSSATGRVLDPHALIDEIDRLRGRASRSAHTIFASPKRTLICAAPGAGRRPREGVRPGRHRHHRARHRAGLRGKGRPARDPR